MQVALTNPFSEENIYLANKAASMDEDVDHPVLQPLYHMVGKNLLPVLRNVFVVTSTQILSADIVAADKYLFSRNNICLNILEGVDDALESELI